MLEHLVLTRAARTRDRLGVSFDDGGADDGQWSLGRTARLELEETPPRGVELLK
jgi:hypothetical protein